MFSYALKGNTTIYYLMPAYDLHETSHASRYFLYPWTKIKMKMGWGGGGGGHRPCFLVDEITNKINFPAILSNLANLICIFAISPKLCI